MPHDSNKIYLQGEYGISIDDVSAVIGVGTSDVGTLCTSDNINMWAKFKPVRRAGINPYDSSTWWKAEKGNCGIVPMTFNRSNIMSELSKFTDGGLHGWVYERPTGGAGSPYRLADFNGYFHKALPPYGSLYVTNTSNWGARMAASMGVNIHEGSNVDTTDSTSEITFQMLFGKPYIHPCYVIIDLSDDTVAPQLLQQEENDQHGTMSFDYTFIEGHTYKVYPLFYVSDSKDKDSALDFAQRTLYTCTGVIPQTVTMTANLFLSATAIKPVGENNIVVTVSVSNVSNKDITLQNCYVWLKDVDNLNSTTFKAGEKEIVAPKTFTAKANATTYLISRLNGIVALEDGMTASKARIVISLDNDNKREVLNVMREADDKI